MAPKPDPKALIPHPEDFAAWCEHPVTRFVASVWAKAALKQRDAWTEMSWESGQVDPIALTELRTRADAYRAFLETGLDDYAKHFEEA